MAKIIGTNSDLERKVNFCGRWMLICYALAAVSLVMLILQQVLPENRLPQWFHYIGIPIIFGCGWLGKIFGDLLASYQAGLSGENATEAIVSKLPDTYCGFRNLRITYEGNTSELDMVVTGPTGVFIIETKNRNGTIVGDYGDQQWTQHKVGRGGTSYSENFYSPVKQVLTHTHRLANTLRNYGFYSVYVEPMVYFSNPESLVRVTGDPMRAPAYWAANNGAEAIHKHILHNPQKLTDQTLQKINALLAEMVS